MGLGNSYATFEESTGYTEEKDLHIKGTIPRRNGTEFWLTCPRPSGVSIDEWEEIQQAKWDRIWGKREVL